MRSPADAAKIRAFLECQGRNSLGAGRAYLTGGATALLYGWRRSTVGIDLKLDPEPPGAFEAIARLKDELDVNVELASPDRFIPALSDWRERSLPIGQFGHLDAFHYDLRAQALSKLARAHDRDLADVSAMLNRGLITPAQLRAALDEIEPNLIRFPPIDAGAYRARVERFLSQVDS